MKKILSLLIIIGLVAGGVYLETHTIPAPRHNVEKVVSNERIFK
ncbi:MAG TPA: hypothetical protein VFT64_04895 [Rickettsiales bacterium]|nr:hypothetical protein [Rickettsiales bacterium]